MGQQMLLLPLPTSLYFSSSSLLFPLQVPGAGRWGWGFCPWLTTGSPTGLSSSLPWAGVGKTLLNFTAPELPCMYQGEFVNCFFTSFWTQLCWRACRGSRVLCEPHGPEQPVHPTGSAVWEKGGSPSRNRGGSRFASHLLVVFFPKSWIKTQDSNCDYKWNKTVLN